MYDELMNRENAKIFARDLAKEVAKIVIKEHDEKIARFMLKKGIPTKEIAEITQ